MASLSFGALSAKFREHKSKCKPIFKKWSRSEKEKRRGADMDRPWDEQEDQNRSTQGLGGSLSPSSFIQAAADTEAAAAAADRTQEAGEEGLGMHGSTASVQPHSHARSISGTSHVSVATSNSSNGMPAPRQAGGTFVHPFQQTPRTSTPPLLSYANSLASIANVRDHSPTTITEDDNDGEEDDVVNSAGPTHQPYSSSSNNDNDNDNNSRNSHNSNTTSGVYIHQTNLVQTQNSSSLSQPSLSLQKRPQLATHRTSSSSYIPNVRSPNPPNPQPLPILRIKTSRTSPTLPVHSSRLANDTGSDLYLDCIVDSPTSPKLPIVAALSSPSSAITPMSPFRNSLDGGVSRLRAKSDLDTVTRAEHVRAARRKYEMKERAKEEKYAREEIKRRERADNKRAHEFEKQTAVQYKEQMAAKAREDAAELEQAIQRGKHNRKVSVTNSARPSLSIPRPSLTLGRPSMSRKNTSGPIIESEKYMGNTFETPNIHSPPILDREVTATAQSMPISSPKRRNTAKKKTRSAWTSFILWLRTKLFRLGRR